MKNIIISGGNIGIGYYIVDQLLKDDYKLTVLDIDTSNLEEKENLLPLTCDVSDFARVEECVQASIERFGPIDICIHNACYCTFESMENTFFETYRRVMDVNYFGALNLTKAVVEQMKEQGQGKIIYTSSGVGVMGFMNISPYASSKGAIESLAKCKNLEYEDDNISFHLFHPPLTDTKSASGLGVPKEFKLGPEEVGRGLAKNINKDSFVICHSLAQRLQTKMMYLFPISLGKMMAKATKKVKE